MGRKHIFVGVAMTAITGLSAAPAMAAKSHATPLSTSLSKAPRAIRHAAAPRPNPFQVSIYRKGGGQECTVPTKQGDPSQFENIKGKDTVVYYSGAGASRTWVASCTANLNNKQDVYTPGSSKTKSQLVPYSHSAINSFSQTLCIVPTSSTTGYYGFGNVTTFPDGNYNETCVASSLYPVTTTGDTSAAR